MIVGRGPVVEDLKSQAENLGIGKSNICREVPYDKVPIYYQMGDVF